MIEIPPSPYVGGFPQDSSQEFLERVYRQRLIEIFAVGLVRSRGSGRWPATTPAEWQALCEESADLTPARIRKLRRLYYEPCLFALLVACVEHKVALLKEYRTRIGKKPVALNLVFAPLLAEIQPDTGDLMRLAKWLDVKPLTPTTACWRDEDDKENHQDAFLATLEFLQTRPGGFATPPAGPPPVFPVPLAQVEAELWAKLIARVWPLIVRLITESLAPALDARSPKIGIRRDLIDKHQHESLNPLSSPEIVQVVDEPEMTRDRTENRPEGHTPEAPDEIPVVDARMTLAQLLERHPIPGPILDAIMDHITNPDLTWEEVAQRHKTTRQTIHKYLAELRKVAQSFPPIALP